MSSKTHKELLKQLAPAERKRVQQRSGELIAREKARCVARKKPTRHVRPDSEIDTSDIPPLTEDFFRRAMRNPFLRRAGQRRLKLTHPGRILRDEFMQPVGLSARTLSKALYVSLAKVNAILQSRSAISAEMAVLLAVYFGTSERYWIDLQGHYDLHVAKDRIRAHAARIVPRPGDKTLFSALAESMTQMNEIVRGERAPSREFPVDALSMKALRSKLGLSRPKFAKLLHVDDGTLRNWEEGRREPTGPAKALVMAISRDPTHVLKALAAA